MVPIEASNLGSTGLLSFRLRYAAFALVGVFTLSVVAGLIPLHLESRDWYLKLAALLINNSPIVLAGFCIAWIAMYVDPDADASRKLFSPLLLAGRVCFLLYALVAPIQLWGGMASAYALYAQDASQLEQLGQQVSAVKSQVQAAATPEQLTAILAAIPGAQDRDRALTEQTLEQRKEKIIAVMGTGLVGVEMKQGQARRERIVAMGIESLRIVLVALLVAFALRRMIWLKKPPPVPTVG
ncbi:hypothetical protein [uncultured Thiodictyon sp.]|uniref:hypothetical protein n=1 Tax=uncultured Thiodictyon sp. TaxID=1846217 RepID=UPI0025DC9E40|nr:hypothetical protein [uncultured Thiodictyon sp.]